MVAVGLGPTPLTAESALQLAAKNRPSFQAARLRTERAEEGARAARASAPLSLAVGASSRPELGSNDQDLALTQPIDLFGRRAARARVGGATFDVAAAEGILAAEELQEEVLTAFAEAVACQRRREVAADLERVAEQLLTASRRRFEEGKAPETQVLRSTIEQLRAKRAAEQAGEELRVAVEVLANRIGVEASTIVVPGEVALESVPDPTIEFRADLLKLRGKVRLAEAEVEEARVSGRPELTVQLLRSPWGPERASFAGRVQLSWALLDNERSRHEVKAARREVDAVQEELKEARSRADLEVRLTREALEARQRAVDSAAGILTRTRELVAKAQRGYAEGFGTQVDVLEAVRALREVEHEFAEAQHARTREIIAQYRATGILLKGIR